MTGGSTIDFFSRRSVLMVAVLFEGGLGVLALLAGWLVGQWPLERCYWSGADLWRGVLATLPLLVFFFLAVRWPIGPMARIRDLWEEVLRPFLGTCSIAELTLIGLLAGIGEELLFRGLLQGWLENWLGIWPALILASALFGLAHVITITYAILAGAIGVFLGWLWIDTGNLLTPIVAHGLYDVVGLIYLLKIRKPPPIAENARDVYNPIVSEALSLTQPAGATMKAAYIEQTGPPEAIRFGQLPTPEPTGTQVLVKVTAVAVNPIDTYLRSGAVPMSLPSPFIVGCDLAGVVEAVGPEASRYQPGERVWGSNQGLLGRQGTFAEYAVVDECWLYPVPEGIEDQQAAAIALVGITAHLGLVRTAGLTEGESLFVNGGSGGVGSTVLQMAKALGARVITTAGSEAKLVKCQQLGADVAVNYKTDDVDRAIGEFAPNGIDVWFETTRNPDFQRSVPLLAKRSRFILMAGREAQPVFPIGPFYVKDCSLHGYAMFNACSDEQQRSAQDINAWLAAGKLKANIDRVLPLSETAAAHRLQEESTLGLTGALAGKIVLTP